jgi:hypothetical protein
VCAIILYGEKWKRGSLRREAEVKGTVSKDS